jgi:hypothetical protein
MQIELPDALVERLTALAVAQGANVHQLPPVVPDPVPGMAAATPGSVDFSDLAAAAVTLLEVHWVKDENDVPPVAAFPFQKLYSDCPADPLLRQRSARDFDLEEPFVYRGRRNRNNPTNECVWVVARNPESTDFASIPAFLTWLIPRYGRHTMAALVHDHLQRLITPGPSDGKIVAGEQMVTSTEADYIMREAMRSSGVPFAQRWIVWSGISVRTLVTKPLNLWYAFLTLLWILLYGVGVGVIGLGWVLTLPIIRLSGGAAWTPAVWMLLLPLTPALLALLWWPRWNTGVIGGLALMLVAMPVVFITLASCVYWLVELLAKLRPKHEDEDEDTVVTYAHNPIFDWNWAKHGTERVESTTPTT